MPEYKDGRPHQEIGHGIGRSGPGPFTDTTSAETLQRHRRGLGVERHRARGEKEQNAVLHHKGNHRYRGQNGKRGLWEYTGL